MAENKKQWYVLRAISGKENKVEEYINNALVSSSLFREYVSQVLIPREKVVTLKNGKRTEKERNLLPGYLLVECYLCDESFPLLRSSPAGMWIWQAASWWTPPSPQAPLCFLFSAIPKRIH